jgi:predicted PurR-regulated permease PerM
MKRIMGYTAVVLATLTGLFLLWQFRLVLLLFISSLFIAAMIRPLVDWLSEHGLPRGVAQLFLYLLGIGSFLLLLLLGGDMLMGEINSGANRAVVEYEILYDTWREGAAWQQTAVGMLPRPLTVGAAQDWQVEQMLPAVMNVGRGVTAVVGGILLTLALSFYWSADQYRFERLWLSLLPPKRRAYARASWRGIETAVGSYLRSQLAQSGLAAVFVGLGAWLAGLEYPLLLAFFAALAALVPFFGGLLTAVIAFGLGSLESIWIGTGMAIYTLVVFVGLDFFVESRLWQRKRRSFLLTILVIIPLFEAFGLWGLIVAPPLAAALEVLIKQAYAFYTVGRDTAVRLDDLEARYQYLIEHIAQSEDGPVTPELQSITERLSELLSKSHDMSIP